jgi:hypothetical protein
MLIKQSMEALLRNKDKSKLKYKIQKANRDWVTEKEDNYREHLFDKKNQTWKFNFKDSALDKNSRHKQGPFTMSRLAGLAMCAADNYCPIHNKSRDLSIGKIPHFDEADSAMANIGNEAEEKRSHDFDGINIDFNNNEAVGR